MIEVIKSPSPVKEKTQWTVFLAGPMNCAPSWQVQAPKVAAQVGIENLTMLNPRKTERFVTGTYQVNWETFGLRMCDVILFGNDIAVDPTTYYVNYIPVDTN